MFVLRGFLLLFCIMLAEGSTFVKLSHPTNGGQAPSNPPPGQWYGNDGVLVTDWQVLEIGSNGVGASGPLFAQHASPSTSPDFFGIAITQPGVYLVGYNLGIETAAFNNWAHGWLKFPVYPTSLSFPNASMVTFDTAASGRYETFSNNAVQPNGWLKRISGSTLIEVTNDVVYGGVGNASFATGIWPTLVLELYSGQLVAGDIWATRIGCPSNADEGYGANDTQPSADFTGLWRSQGDEGITISFADDGHKIYGRCNTISHDHDFQGTHVPAGSSGLPKIAVQITRTNIVTLKQTVMDATFEMTAEGGLVENVYSTDGRDDLDLYYRETRFFERL